MAFSSTTYTGDGTTKDFTIPFDYLDRDHVKVAVDRVRTTNGSSLYEFSFVNDTTVRVVKVSDGTSAPDTGLEIEVFRETPVDNPAVVFGSGAALTTTNLNKLADYLTYALQEATDDNNTFNVIYLGAKGAAPTVDNNGDPLIAGAVYFDTNDNAPYYYDGSSWIAGNSAALADAAKTAAEAAQTAAEAAQTAAEAAQTAAEDAQTGAEAAETNAAASETKAQAWAEEDEDVEVEAGQYSAKHWAAKAEADAASINPSNIVTLDGTQTISGDKTHTGDVTHEGDVDFDGRVTGDIVTLVSGATVTPDMADGNRFELTLDQSLTIANPSNMVVGQTVMIILRQDGTGGRTATWGAYWKFPGGCDPVLTGDANAIDIVVGEVISATEIVANASFNYS